ncbi:hypothetical protein [Fluviispira multicolorata]|uniref:Threonine/homoserine/homoserine lactone efflux protein n=1 Tax=Fluviispira multicolorata TaxID=2654512 RepID=A0A833N643_9BACT|nr:hypothetical protein [Fluviispira multicolorata]KAB8029229.1 hypothetical protein GCL57_11885 [Fluviispira multicolorata]
MVFLEVFICAFIGALLSTLPLGLLNIRLLLLFIKGEHKRLFFFQLGILIVDIIICNLAFILSITTHNISTLINFGKNNLFYIQILFLIVLIYMGLNHIFEKKDMLPIKNKQVDNLNTKKNKSSKLLRHFLEGIVGTLTIPSLLPFWYLWWMGQNLNNSQPILFAVILIAIGVCIGDLIIFKSYRYFVQKISERVLQLRIAKIEKWVGYFFLFLAFLFAIKFFLY